MIDRFRRAAIDVEVDSILDFTVCFPLKAWIKSQIQNPNEDEICLTKDPEKGFPTPIKDVKKICAKKGWKLALEQIEKEGYTEVNITFPQISRYCK